VYPLLNGGLIALLGTANRLLPTPAQLVEQPTHLALLQRNTEVLGDEGRHPLTGPDVALEPLGFGPLLQ